MASLSSKSFIICFSNDGFAKYASATPTHILNMKELKIGTSNWIFINQ